MSDTHKCPAFRCGVRVSFEHLACERHWYLLPRGLRRELLFEYRHHFGEQSYLDARARCVAYLEGGAATACSQ